MSEVRKNTAFAVFHHFVFQFPHPQIHFQSLVNSWRKLKLARSAFRGKYLAVTLTSYVPTAPKTTTIRLMEQLHVKNARHNYTDQKIRPQSQCVSLTVPYGQTSTSLIMENYPKLTTTLKLTPRKAIVIGTRDPFRS